VACTARERYRRYAAASARRRLKRAIRSPLTAARLTPVYAAWQLEQTSTDNVSAVDRIVNDVPQLEQTTSTEWM
jgi:hypothetical protein